MTLYRKLILILCFGVMSAACSSQPSELAFDESDTADVPSEQGTSQGSSQDEIAGTDIIELVPATTTPTTTAAQPTTTSTTSTSTTTTSTTSTSTTSTSTTTTSTTTTIPTVTTVQCQGTRYALDLPSDWFHLNCEGISPATLYDPNVPPETEWTNEITASFTTAETFDDIVDRMNATATVLSTSSTTVDGLRGQRFSTTYEFWRTGEREIVVVDAGDGAFILAADQLADSNDNGTFADIDDRYTHTLTTFEEILATAVVDEAAAVTAANTPGIVSFEQIDCITGGFSLTLAPGYTHETALIGRSNNPTVFAGPDTDGNYLVPDWTTSSDIIAAYAGYSDGEDTSYKKITYNCGN